MALIKNVNTMVSDAGGGTKKPAQKPASASSAYNQQLLSQAPKPTGGSASSAYNVQLVQQAQQAQREAQRQKELEAQRAAGSASSAYNQYLISTIPATNPGGGGGSGGAAAAPVSVSPAAAPVSPAAAPSGGTNSGYDLSEYLRQQQAAALESELAGLKGAYAQSLAAYNAALDKLPQTYDVARNSVAGQNALARQGFDERAAAAGLSSGAAAQAELARDSVYRGTLAGIDREQANAASKIELTKANLQSQYETALAQARASGDASLANALYQELVRVQGLSRDDEQRAQNIALQYGLKNGVSLGDVANIRSISDLANLTYYGSNGKASGGGGSSGVSSSAKAVSDGATSGNTVDSGLSGGPVDPVVPETSYFTPDGVDARTLGGSNYNAILTHVLGGTFKDYRDAMEFIMNASYEGNITSIEAGRLDQIARNKFNS